jgi:hypothetical protein
VDLKDRLRLEAFVKLIACEEIDDDDDEVLLMTGNVASRSWDICGRGSKRFCP